VNQNVFVFLAPVLVLVGFLVQRTKKPHLTKLFVAFVAITALIYTILRNLPGSWLAPDVVEAVS
jgi:predicted permease